MLNMMLVELGGDALAQDVVGHTPLHYAEKHGHEAVVSFLRKNMKIKRRSQSTTALVVDLAAQADAEAAAAAMAALLIAEAEDQKHAPPSKQGNSNKARRHRNRRKSNLYKPGAVSKGLTEAIGGSVASNSGRTRDNADDGMGGRDAAHHCEPDRRFSACDGEESAGLTFKNDAKSHHEQEKERLVRPAAAELSTHVQKHQQPTSIEPLPSGTLALAVASAEDNNTCVLCLAAPKDSLLLPCNHMTMCAECTKEVLSSSSHQPQCPVCGSRVDDCIHGL
jgi:hypothetical protein